MNLLDRYFLHELGHLLYLEEEYRYVKGKEDVPPTIDANSQRGLVEAKRKDTSGAGDYIVDYKRPGDSEVGLMASGEEFKDYYLDHILKSHDKSNQYEPGGLKPDNERRIK